LVSSKTFHIICNLFFILLLVLLLSQIITLAFWGVSSHSIDTQQKFAPANVIVKEALPKSYILSDNYDPAPPSNMPVYDSLSLAERREKQLPTSLPNYQPYYGKKAVYLTFDDGPDPENTPVVLELLRKNKVKATFFITGNQAEKYPELLKQIYLAGHAIGNHSYNHIYRELYQSPEAYTAQLHRTDDVIKNIIGVRPLITRAPGGSAGSFNRHYWDLLEKEGYIEVGWNISSGDASSARSDQIFQNIVYQMNNKFLWSHAIILMHDGRGHSETVKALPHIINYLKQHGFEFRVVNLYTPPPW
jgi:peptidoglycan/xylan/chitin deacetylase (PgdA/CDA1 family)